MVRKEVDLSSLEESQDFARKLGKNLKGGEVVTFSSDLGGGKTTIIKTIVSGTGSSDVVSSPTFTICNTYSSSKFKIYHFDFYRLTDPGVIKHQLDEAISDNSSVVLIEWPKIIESIIPTKHVNISINVLAENSRRLIIDFPDEYSYLFNF